MLQLFSTDRQWELLARNEPFWSVATFDRFRRENLTDENKREFFQTGEDHVERLFQLVRERFNPNFAPERSIDFGCGVGRVLIPLAKRSIEAVGVDISKTMLQEARREAEARQVTNVKLIEGDDQLSAVEGPFDFVHSLIVFQHIPVQRGEMLFRELIKRMRHGGVAAIHFIYTKKFEPYRPTLRTRWRRLRHRVRRAFQSLLGNPQMQMNDYSMSILLRILQEQGVKRTYVELFDHEAYYGAILMFQQDPDAVTLL